MTFPTDPQDVRIEMLLGGFWTALNGNDPADASHDVQNRSPIQITRGRADESGTAGPSTLRFVLNNRSGKYSPRNPSSPYWQQFGRNTRTRALVRWPGRDRTGIPATAGNLVPNSTFETNVSGWQAYGFGYGGGSVAQSAVRAWQGTKSALVTWPTSAGTSYIGTSDGQVSLVVGRRYTLSMYVYVPATNPDVRATVGFVTSGSYTSVKDAWTRITCTFVASNATSNFTVGVESAAGTTAGQTCYIDGVMLDEGPSALAFTTAALPLYPRFYGEAIELPPKWDVSGRDAWVPVQAAGILRRIGQGSQPVNSGLKNYYLSTTPVTYWPLDDGPAAIKGAPAANSTYRGSSFFEAPSTVVTSFGTGVLSEELPLSLRINDTIPAAGGGFMLGYAVGSQLTPSALAWEFLYRADPMVSGDGTNMSAWFFDTNIEGTTAGTFDQWEMQFRRGANNDIQLVLTIDTLGAGTVVTLADSAPLAALTDGQLHHVRLSLAQNAGNVDYIVYVDGVAVISGTRNTHTLRRSRNVSVLYDRLVGEDLLAFGHLIVWEGANVPAIATTAAAAFGFAGEKAGTRFQRLCGEVAIPFESVGDLTDTMPMGKQYSDYFSAQLLEIEATDLGMIYEPRATPASGTNPQVGYQTRTSLYAQTPALTIDYAANQLYPSFEPTDDDLNLRNDVFAQRREGSSFQATQTTGPLSIQDPPNGVGRYKDEKQVNCVTDDLLEGIASWLLHLGTVDEPRYPQLVVNLSNPNVANHATLPGAILTADQGSLLALTNADHANIPDDVKALIVGYIETISNDETSREHTIAFNAVPGSPYDVAKYGSGVGTGPDRYDTAGSQLASGVNSSATSLSVADVGGTLWTTVAGEFPFSIYVGGEQMTVTNITGGSSPQTFTVTRSVNGVVKSHAAGVAVRLWKTPRYGL